MNLKVFPGKYVYTVYFCRVVLQIKIGQCS